MGERKPTFGRIVIFRVPMTEREAMNGGEWDAPAIVTQAGNGELVDLRVFYNSSVAPAWVGPVAHGPGDGEWLWPDEAAELREGA